MADETQNLTSNAPQEHEIRVQKIKKLQELGIDPWPNPLQVTATSQQVVDEFDADIEKEYRVAGRILTSRLHGKTAFATIQDRSGQLQLYFKKDILGDQKFELFEHLIDLGDIIWAEGIAFKTKSGQITLRVDKFELLSKCLYPLPEKFHGLADVETRYRQRYLDLISSSESREKFKQRSLIVRYLRQYLDNHGYLEVETPMLHPIAGGAAARPFITHHNTLNDDFYLRIAPELYLKRLVVGGFDRVYEINRNFRNEGVSTRHNPEFTMLEFYTAHVDYHHMMSFTEEMLRQTIRQVYDTLQIPFGDHTLDFEKPFERISIKKSVVKYGGIPEAELSGKKLDEHCEKYKISFAKKDVSDGEKIFALFEELVEPKLIQPTFITEFPIEVSPLAKRDKNNPEIAARFELFMAGMELANGFNELNDPFDQESRFHHQLEALKAGDKEAHQFDADFILALQHALPPTTGVGIGIDRLVMLLTNTISIKDVILFPTLKKKH
jgi:lysyl-tRNA synthetase class 2